MTAEDKDLLIKMADGLWNEVVSANSCLLILLYYREALCTGFVGEYNCSAAFHSIVQQALSDTLFMNLAKLYDTSSKGGRSVISVGHLIRECRAHVDVFPDHHPGGLSAGWNFRVNSDDYKYLQSTFPDKHFVPVEFIVEWPYYVNLAVLEIFDVFDARLHRYKRAISNLTQRRNKSYAHNDGTLCFDTSEFFKENDILWSDITKLLDLAYEICNFVLGTLTNVSKPRSYTNVDDIRNLFHVLRLGRRHSLEKRANLSNSAFLPEAVKNSISEELSKLCDESNDFLEEIKVPARLEGTYTDALIHSEFDET